MKRVIIHVNNYQLKAKVKSMPIHKIIKQERLDSKHTVIIFDDVTDYEIQLINKLIGGRENRLLVEVIT